MRLCHTELFTQSTNERLPIFCLLGLRNFDRSKINPKWAHIYSSDSLIYDFLFQPMASNKNFIDDVHIHIYIFGTTVGSVIRIDKFHVCVCVRYINA